VRNRRAGDSQRLKCWLICDRRRRNDAIHRHLDRGSATTNFGLRTELICGRAQNAEGVVHQNPGLPRLAATLGIRCRNESTLQGLDNKPGGLWNPFRVQAANQNL
jgi:hypothetical protein